MGKITFSVIIPTYNRADLIGNAIASVLDQTFADFELIVVDDGSQDNTKSIIQSFADKRLRYFYKENGGQNSALNLGLDHASGTYVAFLDSDCIWTKDKLQKIFDKYQSDEELACVYHRTGEISTGNSVANNEDYLEGYIYKEVLTQEFMSNQISLSCKRECFQKIGKYDEQFRCFQDDDMCFQLAKNYKVGLVKEVLSLSSDEAENRVTDDSGVRAVDYKKLVEKYKTDVIDLCGNKEILKKYTKSMTLYCRAKMWNESLHARLIAIDYASSWKDVFKVNLTFAYEMLKVFLNYSYFATKYNRWKKIRKAKKISL